MREVNTLLTNCNGHSDHSHKTLIHIMDALTMQDNEMDVLLTSEDLVMIRAVKGPCINLKIKLKENSFLPQCLVSRCFKIMLNVPNGEGIVVSKMHSNEAILVFL